MYNFNAANWAETTEESVSLYAHMPLPVTKADAFTFAGAVFLGGEAVFLGGEAVFWVFPCELDCLVTVDAFPDLLLEHFK
jgi:hypothetical protein